MRFTVALWFVYWGSMGAAWAAQAPDAIAGTGPTIDFPAFSACFLGPNAGIPAGCERMNLHPDTRVDLRDMAVLQRSYALTPGMMRNASETAGAISPVDEIDEYTFSGIFGATVTVDFSTPSVNGRPDLVVRIDLVRPSGSVLTTTASCGNNSRLDTVFLDASGTWKVRVKQYESWSNCGYGPDMELRTGSYTLTVCPSDAPARMIAYGQTHTSGFTADCQVINYQFTGGLDEQASTMYLGRSSLRSMRMHAPNGALLGASGGGQGATLSDILLPTNGSYRVPVEAADNQPPGSFSIGLSELGLANPIAANAPTARALSRVAEADSYSFLGTFGTTVTVDFSTPTANNRPDLVVRLDLIRPNGTVATSTASCGTTARLDTIGLDATGTWTVRVRAYESWFNCGYGPDTSLITGAYMLTVCPSNQPTIAIAYGQTNAGSFNTDCQVVNYQFAGAIGDVASIMYLGPANTRRLQLFLPNGALFATSGGGQGTSLTDLILPTNGNYRIAVEAADNQATGNFSIGLTKLGTATPISFNTVTAGALSAVAEADSYSFSGAFGTMVTVDFLTPTVNNRPDLVVRVDLIRPNGSTATSTASCGTTARLDTIGLDATGTWTVRVRAYESWFNCGYGLDIELITGAYSLTVCPSSAAPTMMAYGETRDGSFNADCQIVNYQFAGQTDDQVTLVYIGPAVLRRMQLFAPNGALLATSGGGQGASLSDVLLPLDGIYRIAVEATDNQTTGNFSIGLTKLGTATPISFNTVTAGALSAVAEADSYSFSGAFGTMVTVDFLTPTVNNRPDLVVRVDLIRPNGSTATSTASCGTTARLDTIGLDATGTWTVRVRAYESWFNCGYGLDIELITGAYSLTVCPSSAAPTMMAYGETRDGSFNADCQIVNYQFAGQTDDQVTLVYIGPAVLRRMQLFAPNGALLATSGGGQGASLSDVLLPLDGIYRIAVEATDNQTTGNFSIGLAELGGAAPLSFDTLTDGMLSLVAEVDAYSFFGAFGSTVTVDYSTAVINNRPDVVVRLDLIRPNGTVATSTATCGGTARLDTVGINATGVWTVRTRIYESWFSCGYGADTALITGAYALTACSSTGSPTAIAYNQQKVGDLSVDCQIRNFDFSGTAGDVATLLYYGPAYARYVKVYAPNGTPLATSGAGLGAAVTDLILPLTGMYRVEVEAADNQALGSFSLGLSRLAGATALTLNTDTPGSIAQIGETDVFSFSGTSGSVIAVQATTPVVSSKPDVALRVDLIRPDGTAFTSTPTCGGVVQLNNNTMDATGTWRVRVRAYESWNSCGFGADTTLLTGGYSVRVCSAASCP